MILLLELEQQKTGDLLLKNYLNNALKKLFRFRILLTQAYRDQARAFSKHVEKLVAYYMRQAIRSDRTTVYNAIKDAGHPQLAELIRRL
jgi:hypothetical protein